jgi:hypothetical protein
VSCCSYGALLGEKMCEMIPLDWCFPILLVTQFYIHLNWRHTEESVGVHNPGEAGNAFAGSCFEKILKKKESY